MIILSNNKDLLYNDKNHYTVIANAIFILIYKKWKSRNYKVGLVKWYYENIFHNNEISIACVKTKVSQLRKYEYTGDTFRISYDLIELFDALKNVDYNKLENNLEQTFRGGYTNFYNLK